MGDNRKEYSAIESAAWFGAAALCFVGALFFGVTDTVTDGATYAILGVAILVFRCLIKG